MNSNTLVLTYCSGYPYEIFERFAGSLYDTGFSGEVIYFIKESDKPTLEELKKSYPKVDYVVTEAYFHVQSFRFVLYNSFLKYTKLHNPTHVFICDSRDVLFQKNIEDWKWDDTVDLYFFGEDKITQDCKYNTSWVTNIDKQFPEEKVWDTIKNKNIICSGTTYGTLDGMKKYVELMTTNLERFPEDHQLKNHPSDQGLHNYLYYMNKLNESGLNVKVLDNKDNLVNTAGYGFVGINSDRKIVNKDWDVSYIVHQYDRFPDSIKAKLSDKYDYIL